MLRQSERKKEVFCNLGSVYYAVSCNPDAAVVFHTPRACSHLALSGYWSIRRRSFIRAPEIPMPERNNLFVTSITDREAIFGGEALLRHCLEDVTSLSWVRYVLLTSGCTAGVIGDDVQAVAAEVERSSGKPIIVIPGAGFMSGHYLQTHIAVLKSLLTRFAPPRPKRAGHPRTAVILGENPGLGGRENVKEIRRLLSAFGFERILFPPNVMTMNDFSQIADADLIMPTGISLDHFDLLLDVGKEMAQAYKARFYGGNYPIGLDGTFYFIKELGHLMGEEAKAEQLVKEEKESLTVWMQKNVSCLKGKHYVFVIGFPSRFYNPLPHIHALAAAGMIPDAIIWHNDMTAQEKEKQAQALSFLKDIPFYDGEAWAYRLAPQCSFILTTTLLPGIGKQLNLSIQSVGTAGVKRFLLKAREAVVEKGRKIIYEY
ncbi:nitrogenase component 1 [Dialister sp.]|uniref:nitrogenase component 1 n=1 Tax=Dialister sp. TaxID=1955814 RepID=UPI003EFFF0D3